MILDIAHVSKSFGTDLVLKDVSLRVQAKDRIGLVGVNGSGKSTLLKIINQDLQADEGSINSQRGIKIGYMTQVFMPKTGRPVLEEAQDALAHLHDLERKLRALEQQMSEPAHQNSMDAIMHDYARLTEQFERGGGYEANSQVQGVLYGLGFTQEQFEQEAATLSGGELTKLGLAKLLLQKPDVLLLDEPTNHLDMETMAWLEGFLNEYDGAVIVVSHDRYFLDAVCTGITELLFGVSEHYQGNYSNYLTQRDERFKVRNKAYELQQKEIMRQRAIIARFRSFNREKSIRAAESREKALQRMELLERPDEEKQVQFRFETKRLIGDIALEAEGLSKSYGERTLFSDLSLNIRGGDRIALIGANGIGKTTLIRCIMGKESFDTGEVRFGNKAQVGYYDQRQLDLNLDNDVLNEVWDAFPTLNQTQIRNALGLFLFRGDDVFMPIHLLSGGERARVSLVKLMLKKDNFLILDEPTNHLDADSREALEHALEGFEGTILAVSHDRYFINRFANKVFVLQDSGISVYHGNYNDYQAELNRLATAADAAHPDKTRTELAKERRAMRMREEEQQRLRGNIKKAEEAVHVAEEEYNLAVQAQADPDIYMDPIKAAQQGALCNRLQERVENLFARWAQAEQELADFLHETQRDA